MPQISPPLRIVLAAVALLGVVWFVALRPKADAGGVDAPLPAAPGVAGLTRAVDKADGATKAANASVQRTQQAAGAAAGDAAAPAAKATATKSASVARASKGAAATKSVKSAQVTKSASAVKPGKGKITITKAAPPTKTKPKASPAAPKNPAAPLLKALDRRRVVVLMFRNSSADSSAVAGMVRRLRRRTKVVVRIVSIKSVGRYQTFTSDTPVSQAPTTLVIGPSRRAKVIVGFTSPGELGQAVADVRRSGVKAA